MASREVGMSGMAAVRATMYSTLMRRNSTYVFVMLLGSYVTTNMYLNGTDAVWKSLNRGKSWEEVRANLPPKTNDDDED